jgi:hypothetical protein
MSVWSCSRHDVYLLEAVSKPLGDCPLLRSPRSKRGLSLSLRAVLKMLLAKSTVAHSRFGFSNYFWPPAESPSGSGTASVSYVGGDRLWTVLGATVV